MSGGVADDDSVIVNVLGYMAAVCIVLLMAPQIYHNFVRKSVHGLSLLMVVAWHLASTLVTGYAVFEEAVLPLIIMWGINALSFVVVEAQFVLYHEEPVHDPADGTTDEHPPVDHNGGVEHQKIKEHGEKDAVNGAANSVVVGKAALATLVLTLLTLGGSLASYAVCKYTGEILGIIVGSIVPTVLLAAGFLPQIKEIFVLKSTEGFSFGVTCLDIIGCTCALLTVIITSGGFGAALPFVVLLLFQFFLLALLIAVYPSESMRINLQRIGIYRPLVLAAKQAESGVAVVCGENDATKHPKVSLHSETNNHQDAELKMNGRSQKRLWFLRCFCI